ncbi:hypothetical protein H4582DRAFT_2101369 [Lactarius indigo]|nr:hypothetical protein H4582DRAFT_2101369 [Lactarius indigo]
MIHPDPPPELPPDALDESNLYFDHFSTPPLQNPDTYTAVDTPIPPTRTPSAEGTIGTALNPITLSSSDAQPQGDDQDSRMNSPESEESTHPAVLPAGTHVAPDLPELPEEIIVRGRNTSRTPRAPTRRLSNASVWSHISEEPASSHSRSPTRFSSPPPAHVTTNLTQAVAGGTMPPPISINASNAKYGTDLTSSLDINHEDQIVGFEANDQTLKEEFTREINDVVMGFSQYYLTGPLQFRFDNDFSFRQENLQTAVLLTLQALDTGTAFKEGETAVSILTPQAWHRLVMATLAAILRGHLRSPNRATNGNKSLNWSIDSFVVSHNIPKPLSEGGAIRSMALQLAGYYDTKRANPLHTSPEEFFDSLVEKQTNTLQRIANRTTSITQTVHKELLQDEVEMAAIRDRVKKSIFDSLNTEALNDLDTWRGIYREEFKEVMQKYIAANNFGQIDPVFLKSDHKGKKRAKSATPELEADMERIEQLMRTDTQAQIDHLRNDLLLSMKTEMEREIADLRRDELVRAQAEALLQVQNEVNLFKAQETERLRTEALKQVDDDIAAVRRRYRDEHEAYVRTQRNDVRAALKQWKIRHRNARNLEFLRVEAAKLGYALTPESADAFRPNSDPVEAELDWLPTSRATSRASSRAPSPARHPSTPPNIPLQVDTNVTPTPVRIKRVRTDDTDLREPATDVTVEAPSPIPFPIPIPPSPLPNSSPMSLSPMAEDHPIDALADRLDANGGVGASMHAVTRETGAPQTPTQPHIPEAEPEPPLHVDIPRAAPFPVPLPVASSGLAVPVGPAVQSGDSELVQLMRLIQGTITRLEEKVSAQDARIESLSSNPTPAGRKAAKRSEAVAAPPTANTATTSAAAMDEAPSSNARADDPADAMPTASKPPPVNRATRPAPSANLPPSWSSIVTQKAVKQQNTNATLAKNTLTSTGRGTNGKSSGEAAARRNKANITEVTVIRGQGVDNAELEAALYGTPPSVIVGSARSEIERLTSTPIVLLDGRWSTNASSHNFVYRIAGAIPFRTIYAFRNALVGPLKRGNLIPNDGWTYAQIRKTPTTSAEGVVYDSDELTDELRRNTAFKDAILCIDPFWQGNPQNIGRNPHGTVKLAYVDEDGQIALQVKRDGIFMFNEPVNFVITGDNPTIQMCGRCHKIGHTTDSAACQVPRNSIVCHICAGSHHPSSHAFHCPRSNQHQEAGICRCRFTCINCSGNHNARSPFCPMKKSFAPPPIATISSAPPAAPSQPSAKGKEKEQAPPVPAASAPATSAGAAPQARVDDDNTGFTTVARRNKSQRKRDNRQRANRAIPGAPDYDPSLVQPRGQKLTSKVPARPLTKTSPPAAAHTAGGSFGDVAITPGVLPSWKHIPVFFEQHVATIKDTQTAFRKLVPPMEPEAELAALNDLDKQWHGAGDGKFMGIDSIEARLAVQFGFPLRREDIPAHILRFHPQTNPEVEIESIADQYTDERPPPALTPRLYLIHSIPREQRFAFPGELFVPEPTPEELRKEKDIKLKLVEVLLALFGDNSAFSPAIIDQTANIINLKHLMALPNQQEQWSVVQDVLKSFNDITGNPSNFL